MIVKMHKYTFLVFHKEYDQFLEQIQQLGVLHVVEKNETESSEIKEKFNSIKQFEKNIQLLKKRDTEPDDEEQNIDTTKIISEISDKQKELETLKQELDKTKRTFRDAQAWGNFSPEIIDKLKAEDLQISFFISSKKKFSPELLSDYYTEIISEDKSNIYFIIIHKSDEKLNVNAEEVKQPDASFSEIKSNKDEIEHTISQLNNELDNYARTSIPQLTKEKETIIASLEYDKVILNTETQVEEKVKILEGWVPDTKKQQIDAFLNEENTFHIIGKATKEDKIPILMQNNKFSRLFEPIGKLFSLPAYTELDLTIFFAPFFMLFFGICLGDAGYGLIFIIGAGIYKLKAKKEIKPMLSLVQLLGVATVIFGIITGTFFGINLIETEVGFLTEYKQFFLNPDKMFNVALIMGALQIVFAMFIKAANQIKQYGFAYSLSTFGWLIIILGCSAYFGLTKFEIISENKLILYAILGLGGFFVIFFSDVEVNVFARIGKGVWDIYSTVTGIFGDILSYIRLFALGLSSAILGFVINDIGLQILGSSKIIGPIFFVIFLLLGHTLNILIASLGSFVHPMRLTFVEFYKNAGFQGGGKEYKPFSK